MKRESMSPKDCPIKTVLTSPVLGHAILPFQDGLDVTTRALVTFQFPDVCYPTKCRFNVGNSTFRAKLDALQRLLSAWLDAHGGWPALVTLFDTMPFMRPFVVLHSIHSADTALLQHLDAIFDIKSFHGNFIDVAADANQLKVLRCLAGMGHRGGTVSAAIAAARLGQMEILAFLHSAGYVDLTDHAVATVVAETGAAHGQIEVVRYVLARGGWTGGAVDNAVANGHLEVVKLLHDQGSAGPSFAALRRVVERGHAAVLAYLQQHRPDDCVYEEAVAVDNAEPWTSQCHPLCGKRFVRSRLVDIAAECGRLDMVRQILAHGGTFSTDAMDGAAASGHLAVLHWLVDHTNATYTRCALDLAAANNHVAVVTWLLERTDDPQPIESCACRGGVHATSDDSPFRGTTLAMDLAAQNGHLEMVQLLHRQPGAACSTEAMTGAIANGHMEVVAWLATHRTEGYCATDALDQMGQRECYDGLAWLLEHDDKIQASTWVAHEVARLGRLDLLQLIHAKQGFYYWDRVLRYAARNGHWQMVQWIATTVVTDQDLQSTHRKWRLNPALALEGAAKYGHLKMVQWVLQRWPGACLECARRAAAANRFLGIANYLKTRDDKNCRCKRCHVDVADTTCGVRGMAYCACVDVLDQTFEAAESGNMSDVDVDDDDEDSFDCGDENYISDDADDE
ncbi:Aste57867_11258 [Aphanomyces stellatus]|uniref:Aste57867_11258 protein n=1 Tax=Aphanomyces stellatus TaxID=120398 RepID=A0A485KSV4_9STRA|nr:hypothetical protein As57867_011216 [Aphanomyces stellatus]VFT88122.1 Aste57867_11258 [Aphanomyces stellatus]